MKELSKRSLAYRSRGKTFSGCKRFCMWRICMNPICKNDRTLIVWGSVNPRLVVRRKHGSFNPKLRPARSFHSTLPFTRRRVLLTNSSASGCFNSFMLLSSKPNPRNTNKHEAPYYCSLVFLLKRKKEII